MVVQHNMQAANANRMLNLTVNGQQKSTEKLSSGYRINRAADDAAGLAISEKMRSQIRGLDRASTNAQDGISVVQTAEGALNEVHSMLQRMNELATQAANDTNTSNDRAEIQLEVDQLTSEIDRVASTTQFNTMNLLDGTFTGKELQVGSLSGQTISISIDAMNANGLGIGFTKGAATKGTAEAHNIITVATGGKTKSIEATTDDILDAAKTTGITDLKSPTGKAETYEYDSATQKWHRNSDYADVTAAVTGVLGGTNLTATANALTVPAADSGKNATISADKDGKVTDIKGLLKAGITINNANAAGATNARLTDDSAKKLSTLDTSKVTAQADGTFVDADGNNIGTLYFTNGTDDKLQAADGLEITLAGYQKATEGSDGITKSLDVTTHTGAEDAMSKVQSAIDTVSTQRATLGAVQNRLEHTIANLDTTSENTQAAESRIRDTDMAKEMVTWSKNNILAQAGQSMLAQANQSNQGVLSLLQ